MGERENRIEQAKDHILRASKSLSAANHLQNEELFEDAISRAYYAAFHASKALLISISEDSRTHRGIHHLLYTHFVKEGILSIDLNKKYANLLNYHADADYGVIPIFGSDEVINAINTAESLIKFATNWLSNKFGVEFE